MNFKKLTTKDGNPIFLNIELITLMKRANKDTATLIYFQSKDPCLVKETPEQILEHRILVNKN